jgi:general secretion pathway protein A
MSPDPGTLYLGDQHQEALAGLMYAVQDAKGMVVLTGEAGTGKTTLLAGMLQRLAGARVQASYISNPALTPREFLEMALLSWGISRPPASKAQQLFLIQSMLYEARAQHRTVLLVVDEAQALTVELLEEIRLLGNFEQPKRKLLQIVLAGQNQLTALLNREDLRQFKQRIAVRLHIQPFSEPEAKLYIRYRWIEAGGAEPPFSAEAYDGIIRSSSGIARVINALCDNALIVAFAEATALVTADHVRQACQDLDLSYEGSVEAAGGSEPVPQDDAPDSRGPAIEPVAQPLDGDDPGIEDVTAASPSLRNRERDDTRTPAAGPLWPVEPEVLGFAH